MLIATYFVLWFIGANSTGYTPPLEVRNPPCGKPGAVVGVTFDRPQLPTKVFVPDPFFPEVHCEIDVRAALATLAQKPANLIDRFHFATTIMGEIDTADFRYYHDPHTSAEWTIGKLAPPPPPPSTLALTGTGMQLPAARTLTWDANAPEDNVVGYIGSKNGVDYPQTAETQQPVQLLDYGVYQFAVRAVAADGRVSDPATVTYVLEAPPPPPPCSTGITIRVDDWTRDVPIGGRGKVSLMLANSFPIVLLQVKLGGQVIGEVTGTDLRDLAGLYFSVPRTAGSYNITVAAKDSTNCTEQTTAIRMVNVQ